MTPFSALLDLKEASLNFPLTYKEFLEASEGSKILPIRIS
jgi:hypothetical protein